eukprot:g2871.t1
MQFTPQQLAGGARYSNSTKIGNWSEEKSLEQLQLADFLKKKADGTLLAAKDRKRDLMFLGRVPHSYSADGLLRFGDSVMLQNINTESFLVANTDDRIEVALEEAYSVSAAPPNGRSGSGPVARNTFVITKWPKYDYEDDVVRYQQPFMLACNPNLRVDEKTGLLREPLYLTSRIVDTMRHARVSNHQEVSLQGGRLKYEMVWSFNRIADRSYHSGGDPVPAGQPTVIIHEGTKTPLSADTDYPSPTNFGFEYEVACHKHLSNGKTLNMINESKGKITADVGQRAEKTQNQWVIVTAAEPNAAVDSRSFTQISTDIVLQRIRAGLGATAGGVDGLLSGFRVMDDRGNGCLDREDFRWGLSDYGINLTDEEFDILHRSFDNKGDTVIAYEDVIAALQN